MEATSVSLSDVLAASGARAASLVPETSGYLALAIADACARLPFRLDDALVTLTSEGSVKVARGTVVVPPDESARRVRDVLARLLTSSIGSAPALAAAARPRRETSDGVDGFVRELEAALVPVNRAAARRALARLARETMRAKQGGRLKRRRPKRTDEALEAAAPALAPPAPAPPPALASRSAPVEVLEDLGVDVDFSAAPPADDRSPDAAPELRPGDAAACAALDLEPEEAPTTIDAPVIDDGPAKAEGRPPKDLAAAFRGAAKRSDVDDLLAKFAVSELATPEHLRATRASLKRLAGLDATPPPPTAAELKKLTQRPPPVASAPQISARVELRAQRSAAAVAVHAPAMPRSTTIALVALGLMLAGLLGHFVPRWLG
ncbi:MAG: hypothetical protein IPM79_34690 [Polyangiaceae bacterium]|nr:hypothetical protein [Polyangiaceae bacterium]